MLSFHLFLSLKIAAFSQYQKSEGKSKETLANLEKNVIFVSSISTDPLSKPTATLFGCRENTPEKKNLHNPTKPRHLCNKM